MSFLHSSDPIAIAQPTTVYKKLSWRIVEKYIRFVETKHMVRTIFNEHEFKETMWNLFKSAAKEGAMEGMREVMQSANSSSQTPAKEAVLPSSAVGTNDPASIKGKKIPCINNLQLMFVGDVESPVFTNTNMLKRKLPVKLIDNKTGSLVSIGPEASAELEVGLLDGRYRKQKDLKRDHILAIQLKPREKKSQYLLKGGSNRLTLVNGEGEIPMSLAITDTSRMGPTLNGTFCFSLVPSDPESSIQGATSNEFTVLDKKAKDMENTMLHCAQSMQEHGNIVMETDHMYPPMDQRTFESQNLQFASNGDHGAMENPVSHCSQSLHEHGNTFMETYQHMYQPIDQRTFESQNPQIASDGEDHGGVANNPLSYGQGMVGYSDINKSWPNTDASPPWHNF